MTVASLLTNAQLDSIKNSTIHPSSGRFPTWHPIFNPKPSTFDVLSNSSVRIVSAKGGTAWLTGITSRLTNLGNPEDAAAALSELRVYGAFLEAGFSVTPIPTATHTTPDFEVDAGDQTVVVEVFSKHAAPLSVTNAGTINGKNIQGAVTVHQPAGIPDPDKLGDSVQANVISRVCRAKQNEAQIPEDKPSILWIDFGNFGLWPQAVTPDQSCPLISGRDGITSGALWYAFFGWKGAPIFEPEFDFHEKVFSMGHDGRFMFKGKQKSKLSGVVFGLNEASVLFENPWANVPISEQTRRYFERLPWFDLDRSVMDWSQGDAEELVAIGRRKIERLLEWHSYFDSDECEI
ncbi:MAG: hypothetical protein ACFHHU_00875 [Porticoccaceae bacterium]